MSTCNFYSPTPWDVKTSYVISAKNLLHFALLHFASKRCYILTQKVVTFRIKKLLHFASVAIVKPSFHMIAHDRQIAENTASDRQRLYGNTFQRSGDRERSNASVIPAIRRS